MLFLKGFFILILLIIAPSLAVAGAWTLPKNKWEYYYGLTYYNTDHYYDDHGKRHAQDAYSKLEDSHRFEFGYSDETTLGAALHVSAVKSTALISSITLPRNPLLSPGRPSTQETYLTGWNYGISDPQLYLRHRFWQDDSSLLSAQGTVKFPSLFNSDILARSGSDETTFEARLLGGHNYEWLGKSHFADASVAYEWRPENEADMLHIDATTGLRVNEKWMILPQLFSDWHIGDSSSGFTQSGDDAYDLVKGQLSAVYALTPMISLQAGGYQHLYARNTGGGNGLAFGIWVKP